MLVTLTAVDAVTLPYVAEMVVTPWLAPLVSPGFRATVATVVAADDQVDSLVQSCFVLSLKVPMTESCWFPATAIAGPLGFSVSAVRATTVTLALADFVESACGIAVTVTVLWLVGVAGAVYTPALLMLPFPET